MKKIILPIITTIALAAATLSARANDTNAVPATAAGVMTNSPVDPWQFGIGIPLWAPKINGTATVLGHKQDVNVSFSQLREHLDTSISLAVEARKGKYDLFGDVGYMKFSVNNTFPDGHVKSSAQLKFLVADAEAGYVLIQTESAHPFMLEGTAGVRYWYASLPVTFKDDGGAVLFKGSKTWDIVDPIIGIKASQYFTEKLHMDIRADGGGFDLNNDTDWTWLASGVLTYDFAKWFSLSAGYQALALNESKGSGVGKGGKMGADLVMQGALVSLNFKF